MINISHDINHKNENNLPPFISTPIVSSQCNCQVNLKIALSFNIANVIPHHQTLFVGSHFAPSFL